MNAAPVDCQIAKWCLQHGIRPGTFYNWVSRIKKKGDAYIPDPGGAAEYWPEAKPDIVQINLVREDTKSMSVPQETEKPMPRSFKNLVNMIKCCQMILQC